MKTLMAIAAVAAAGINGCLEKDVVQDPPQAYESSKTNCQARYLCVGMETSKRFGSCPGCEQDATRLSSLLSGKFGYSGDLLISEQATKSAVVSKLREGIDGTPEGGLFLFMYSGHGGQEYLGGKEPDGSDREDEYLCLYDTHMMDDEIWSIVSKCRGRVFLYFDACHSATMYRSVASVLSNSPVETKVYIEDNGALALNVMHLVQSRGFKFDRMLSATAMSSSGSPLGFGMLCWSGCKEAEYSYGGSRGGVMTNALLSNWKREISYTELWKKVWKRVTEEQPTQNPQQTVMGSGFSGKEAFR